MRPKKESELKIRCTRSEKKRITERAKSSGKTISEFTREMLLKGKVVCIPAMNEREKEAVFILKKVCISFKTLSNLIKTKNPEMEEYASMLIGLSQVGLRRFFDPDFSISDEFLELLEYRRQ